MNVEDRGVVRHLSGAGRRVGLGVGVDGDGVVEAEIVVQGFVVGCSWELVKERRYNETIEATCPGT